MHTDAHAHVRNHTHAANQKETGLSRDAIGGVRVSAAVLPRAPGHGNIRTHAPPAAPPPAARGAHPGLQAHCYGHLCEDHRSPRHPNNINKVVDDCRPT